MRNYSNIYIKRWWKSTEPQILISVILLIIFGMMLVTSVSPSVANKIGASSNYFIKKHIIYVLISIVSMISFSCFSLRFIKIISIIGFLICIISLGFTIIYGVEIKGATRWINLLGFSYQPSEFTKIFFTVVVGWLLSITCEEDGFPGLKISIILYIIVTLLLVLQPDFGMLSIITATFVTQLFLAGLSIKWLVLIAILSLFGLLNAYLFMPHITQRIDSYMNPNIGDNYQINQSMMAFRNGGLYGVGPGEGSVKQHIADGHADFIFAVIGEEFGAIIAILVLAIFMFIVIRVLWIFTKQNNIFVQITAIGIIMQIGLQASVNIAVTIGMLPTKGITLPFISYGGSSLISVSIAIGMILSMVRSRKSYIVNKNTYNDNYTNS